jgi:hypothetical protein
MMRAGRIRDIEALQPGLVLAVDIGFASSRTRSCGLASNISDHSSLRLTFENAVQSVADLLRKVKAATLILESPLSYVFDAHGNPIGRLSVERIGSNTPRYWYLGAGAVTSFAAVFFLRRLVELVPRVLSSRSLRLTIFEGFVSYYVEGRIGHREVAERLVQCFAGFPDHSEVLEIATPLGGRVLTVFDLLSYPGVRHLPAVVVPHGFAPLPE